MKLPDYDEYLSLCDAMHKDPLPSGDKDIGEHFDRLCDAHREQFGAQSDQQPVLNERPPTFEEYKILCQTVGAVSQAEATNWGAHYKHLSHLGKLPAPLTWDEVPKPATNKAAELEPTPVSIQIPIALQSEPQAAPAPSLSWPDYVALAIRTESVPEIHYLTLRSNNLEFSMDSVHTRQTRLLHVGIGLLCEAVELEGHTSLRNKIEELGDCFWYLAVASDVLAGEWTYDVVGAWDHIHQTSAEEGYLRAPEICLYELRREGQAILDIVGQKATIYGKPLDTEMLEARLNVYFYNLLSLAFAEGGDWRVICQANIDKLAKRYPHLVFSLEQTSNRDTENELSHILTTELAGNVEAAAAEAMEDPKA